MTPLDAEALRTFFTPGDEVGFLHHFFSQPWWAYDASRYSTELAAHRWGVDVDGGLRVSMYAQAMGLHITLQKCLRALHKCVRPELTVGGNQSLVICLVCLTLMKVGESASPACPGPGGFGAPVR